MTAVESTTATPHRLWSEHFPHLLADNQICGYQVLTGDTPGTRPKLDGLPVRLSSPDASTVQVLATHRSSVQSFHSNELGLSAYLWGVPSHSAVPPAEIPAWCATLVAREEYARFLELVGTFVVIVDEPRKRRLTFI